MYRIIKSILYLHGYSMKPLERLKHILLEFFSQT